MYEIEKGIEMPTKTVYPFGTMEIGNSFEFPKDERTKVATAIANYQHKHQHKSGARFSIRTTGETLRCWRVE